MAIFSLYFTEAIWGGGLWSSYPTKNAYCLKFKIVQEWTCSIKLTHDIAKAILLLLTSKRFHDRLGLSFVKKVGERGDPRHFYAFSLRSLNSQILLTILVIQKQL